MPLNLMCRRCGNEVHFDDAFCQECGLPHDSSSSQSLPAREPSDFDWPPLDPMYYADPLPENPAVTSLSGQTYAFANYQLDLESWLDERMETAETSLNEPCAVPQPDGALPACPQVPEFAPTSLPAGLPSDDFVRDNGLGMRGGWAMVLTDLAVAGAVVSFASVLAVWGYNSFQKQEIASQKAAQQKIMSTVLLASAKGDYRSVMDSLALWKAKTNRNLDEKQQLLLDEAAYQLGQKAIAAGRIAEAVSCLKQVSITSDYYVSARQIIFNYAAPSQQASNLSGPEEAPAAAAPATGLKQKRQNHLAVLFPDAAPITPAAPSTPVLSTKPVLSIPIIPEIEKPSSDKQDAEATQAKAPEPAAPKFSESEISRYNRLLARYFVKHAGQKNQDQSAEPPSFKEWLRQGKTAF